MSFLNKAQKKKAVCYYRHSAEDKQENSVPIQREHAEKFCAQFDIEILHAESDEGVSGLTANRPGFKRLFKEWIENPSVPRFDYVLVYDVSRWGRFQNQNEAAYYEFLCEQNHKKVIYISRGFPREEQELTYSIITPMERWMAAQYSKQLSEKVWYGCIKVSQQGYSAGGTACYGMARLLLDESKKPIGVLKKGEHKMISNQRVTFAPTGDETTKAVQEIFDLMVNHWKNPSEIAEILNEKGIPSAKGGLWNAGKVIRILSNETYTGTRIYNKTWGRLKQTKRDNPRSEWVVTPNAFDSVVNFELFGKAQEHLYWLMPSKWKKGIHTINRVRLSALKEVEQLLMTQGLNEGEIEAVLPRIPLTFSVSFYKESVPHWCFVIDESMRQYDFVLGISIVLDKRNPIDQFFMLPTKDFNTSNFIVCSEKDSEFSSYKIQHEQIQESILSLQKQATPKKVAA